MDIDVNCLLLLLEIISSGIFISFANGFFNFNISVIFKSLVNSPFSFIDDSSVDLAL